MKKLMIVGLLLACMQVAAQTTQELQYAAYLKASKTLWIKSVKVAEKQHGNESFERAIALYGLLRNTMESKDEETFNAYQEETIELLELLIEQNASWGEPKAVLSSIYGLVMAYSPTKGMFLGMKSSSLMEDAMKQQPESALVQMLNAESKLYTPAMWGGDPEQAVKGYEVAVASYKSNNGSTNNWLYLDAMMGLAFSYKKTKDLDAAKETLKLAIQQEAEFYWAKSELEELERS